MQSYSYIKTPVNFDRLTLEIQSSSITIVLEKIESGPLENEVITTFRAALSNDEKTILDAIVAAHTGEPLPSEALIVTPTVPLNDYQLTKFGSTGKKINTDNHVTEITLSNKNGYDYTFTLAHTISINHEDSVFFYDANGDFKRIEVESVNGTTITLEEQIDIGTYGLSVHAHIDYLLPYLGFNWWYLFGAKFNAKNNGEDDWCICEIVTPEGEDVKVYDDVWVEQMNQVIHYTSPDGGAGQLPPTYILRIDYFPTERGKIIKVKVDYDLEVKDA